MKQVIFVLLLILAIQPGCKQEIDSKPQKAILSFIIGDVLVDDLPGKINQEIKSETTIATGEKSRAEIRIGTGSGIQIRENSKVKLIKDQNRWKTEVTAGAVLNLFRPGSKYQLNGPAAVIAIRGTIFYVNCYADGSQYVCTCNGTIGISSEGKGLSEVSASHHKPYTIIPSDEGVHLQPAEMKEHNDVEIMEFMYRVEREPQK
jgi:hypothetical protein